MIDVATILVVEDDEDDFFLTQRALRRQTKARIERVESGRAAIEYLAGRGVYADRSAYPAPEIVFLDLKMDQGTGHEVLSALREQRPTPMPRVFVLTGSNEPRDRDLVKSSGIATGYIVKPLSPEHVARIFSADDPHQSSPRPVDQTDRTASP
jgi:CheY-like chemotaxis protein